MTQATTDPIAGDVLLERIRGLAEHEWREYEARARTLAGEVNAQGWRALAGHGLDLATSQARYSVAARVVQILERDLLAPGRTMAVALGHVASVAAHEFRALLRSGIPVHCSCPLTSALETAHRAATLQAWDEVAAMAAKYLARGIADDSA